MSTNYRSPAEVFDLAATVVRQAYPQADRPRAVRSVGVEPRLLVAGPDGLVSSTVDLVPELLSEVEGTVGVIGPQPLLSALTERLAAAGALASGRVRATVPPSPRVWSTTRYSSSTPIRSWRPRQAARGLSTSR